MNIVLIGYRGCGKSSIGRKLAGELWKGFVDIDVLIVQRFEGMLISEIFKTHGEPKYRQVETEVTQQTMGQDEQVVALGGGTLMQEGARRAVSEARDTQRIYLKCEPEELLRRVQLDPNSAHHRPNLTNLGGGIEEIVAMLKVREPVYEAVADQTFDVTNCSVDEAVRYIIQRCL